MRILFTSIPGAGHFNPTVPLARALTARGHQITYACSPAWTEKVEAAGFRNVPAGPAWVENLADPVMREIVGKELFVELARMGMVEDVVRAARSIDADLIAYEGAEIGGLIATGILQLPAVMVSPAAGKMWRSMIRTAVARAAGEHGLDGQAMAADGYELVYVDRTPASFEASDFVPYPTGFNARPELYEQPAEIPAWFHDLGARPIVYVSLGSVFNTNIGLFTVVADSLRDEPVDVVMATGHGVSTAALGELPANVHVGGYLPQSAMIAKASVVVSHGGYNTVMAAMSNGIPMFCIPMGADQPYNAGRLLAAGAGLSSPIYEGPPVAGPPPFTPPAPEQVRDAVRMLLEDPGFRAGAGRVRAEIEALPPVAAAAAHIEARMRQASAISA
jgi:UDP:flavonoid glycosyltransferase YjiC (YdhE family)